MAKKEVVKEQKQGKTKATKPGKADKINEILLENFTGLQKSFTQLAVKLDNLTQQISSLLQLFELSAKSFAEKLSTGIPDIQKDQEFLQKLDSLMEQNKLIAKGLTLMEEKLREKLGYSIPQQTMYQRPSYSPSYTPGTAEKDRRTRPIQ